MKVFHGDFTQWERLTEPAWVTIGVFDGVHLGHQSILESLRISSGGGTVGVITFGEHPASVTAPEHAPKMLTSLEQRLELLEAYGVAVVAILDFAQVRSMDPGSFTSAVIVGVMNAAHVAVGEGFHFGHNMAGDQGVLTELGVQSGFTVEVIKIMGGDVPVRSTAIRSALANGDVGQVAAMLGRPFQLRGSVVVGDRRGRQLGFPTANLELSHDQALPRRGVYSALTRTADGSWYDAVVNVGVRPTFGAMGEVVEVHLLDVTMDLYGQELWVDFRSHIRAERRFDGIDELVEQIGRDVHEARHHLANVAR
ncbi:MAG: bifunctional riboflavin kinase/FAD synthetase [bacterium]|nr:bifunctional riboflavin kinase/FAD synthetase [bacterium]